MAITLLNRWLLLGLAAICVAGAAFFFQDTGLVSGALNLCEVRQPAQPAGYAVTSPQVLEPTPTLAETTPKVGPTPGLAQTTPKAVEVSTPNLAETSTPLPQATTPAATNLPVLSPVVADGIEDKAEKQYWYQRSEKNVQPHPAFTRYGANWPCIWGEELTGSGKGDGSKWTCGIRHLRRPCVIYSFGSRGNIDFERAVVELGSGCEVHVFDPTSPEPAESRKLGLHYHSVGLGPNDGRAALLDAGVFQVRTLATLMRENGHDHVDILKVDIEFMEHEVIRQVASSGWPSIGQILMEVHIEGIPVRYDGDSLDKIIKHLEQANFRLFHHEVNWEWGATCCIEYAFIQKGWRPGVRRYDMKTASTYQWSPLRKHPLEQQLIDKYLRR